LRDFSAQGATLLVCANLNRLIDDAMVTTSMGGKLEPLRHMLTGAWSRRITEEHRLVYLIDGDDLVVLQARFHYE
jgi:toxin YoeB